MDGHRITGQRIAGDVEPHEIGAVLLQDLQPSVPVQVGEDRAPGGAALQRSRPAGRVRAVPAQSVQVGGHRGRDPRLGLRLDQVAGERQRRLHQLRTAVAVEVGDHRGLAVDDLGQEQRESVQEKAVGRYRGEARGEAGLHEDQVPLPVAVHVRGHEVGVDVAGLTLPVGAEPHRPPRAGQRAAGAVEAQDGPLVHGADDFEAAVPVEIGEQGRSVRAGVEPRPGAAHLHRPTGKVGPVGAQGVEIVAAHRGPGDDAGHDVRGAVAVQVADRRLAHGERGLGQGVERARPAAEHSPVRVDGQDLPRGHGDHQVLAAVAVDVGGDHSPLPRPEVHGLREPARVPQDVGRRLRDAPLHLRIGLAGQRIRSAGQERCSQAQGCD